MIDFSSSLFKEDQLNDCYIIGVQHILPSTYSMFKALINKGLKKENLSLLGKCYSTDLKTYSEMKANGFDISDLSVFFNSHENYDDTFKSRIHEFLSKRQHIFKSSKYKKIIIIDDGGELLDEIEKYVDDFSKIVAIEQTASGYNRLIKKDLSFPIINLARSEAKLTIEYPRVISNAIRKINSLIAESNQKIVNILIIGNGKMGSCLYTALENKYKVVRFDKNNNNSDIEEDQLPDVLMNSDLIIGCTGTISLSKEFHKYLKKNVTLVSLSSSDREFDTVHLRKTSPKTNNPWQNTKCDDVILANNGFPISFDNNNMDDSSFFQFTRALIITSILQALDISNKKGFIELHQSFQKKIIDEFSGIQKNLLVEI
jgi:S-adenosylhomocysteine hydrolase